MKIAVLGAGMVCGVMAVDLVKEHSVIIALKESGFFSEEKINVDGAAISPLQLTSKYYSMNG